MEKDSIDEVALVMLVEAKFGSIRHARDRHTRNQ